MRSSIGPRDEPGFHPEFFGGRARVYIRFRLGQLPRSALFCPSGIGEGPGRSPLCRPRPQTCHEKIFTIRPSAPSAPSHGNYRLHAGKPKPSWLIVMSACPGREALPVPSHQRRPDWYALLAFVDPPMGNSRRCFSGGLSTAGAHSASGGRHRVGRKGRQPAPWSF